jgi:hypothetical protein
MEILDASLQTCLAMAMHQLNKSESYNDDDDVIVIIIIIKKTTIMKMMMIIIESCKYCSL